MLKRTNKFEAKDHVEYTRRFKLKQFALQMLLKTLFAFVSKLKLKLCSHLFQHYGNVIRLVINLFNFIFQNCAYGNNRHEGLIVLSRNPIK